MEASRKSMEATPEFKLRHALEIFADEIESDVIALKLTSTIESKAQQRRAIEIVAMMKQRFQHLEEYFAPTVAPLVSRAEASARLPSACAESPPECAFVTNGKEAMRPTYATAMKTEQQVIAEPAVVEPKPGNSGEPTQFATGLTSIFVGAIHKAVTDDQLQVMLGTKAHIGRRHGKAKFGYAKILIPTEDMDRVLRLDLSVSGHKFRVAKWRSLKAPSHRVPAFVYDTSRRNDHHVKSEMTMKEQLGFFFVEILPMPKPARVVGVYTRRWLPTLLRLA